MTAIEKIDPNFAVKVDFDAPDMIFFNALTDPFRLYGLLPPVNEEDCFRRMPQEIASQVGFIKLVLSLHISDEHCPAGGCSSFVFVRRAAGCMVQVCDCAIMRGAEANEKE